MSNEKEREKLWVIERARQLADYTVRICDNKNIFTPDHDDSVTKDITKTAKDIYISLYMANETTMNKKSQDFEKNRRKRRKLQLRAKKKCNRLLALVEFARPIFHLKLKRLKYWGNVTREVRKLIEKWMDSDIERYY